MRHFGTEISGNRSRGAELSQRHRDYILAQVDAGAGCREIADALSCSIRAVENIVNRYNTTHISSTLPRSGHPKVLSERACRLLARTVKRTPKIEYRKLMEETGLWDPHDDHPRVAKRTVARALEEEDYRKFRAKRRPKITPLVAKERLKFAQDWRSFYWEQATLIFSDKCSVARGSGHNNTWVWRLPSQKWNHEMVEEVTTARQPARMVWAAIWMTAEGVERSPLW